MRQPVWDVQESERKGEKSATLTIQQLLEWKRSTNKVENCNYKTTPERRKRFQANLIIQTDITDIMLNDNQVGFRFKRCTTDQVLKLIQHATDQIHNSKANLRIMTTFFDYVKVSIDGLLLKMINLIIREKLVRIAHHFLSGQKTKVEFNGTRRKAFRHDQGLPQDSCINLFYSWYS